MKIIIINGPNLNLIGEREKHIYGNISITDYFDSLAHIFTNIDFSFFQSNIEGEIINAIHNARHAQHGIVINAGAYSHTSIAIRDAIASISIPVVEVHISNIYNREEFRENLLLAPKCMGLISGFGLFSYNLAIQALASQNTL